MRIIQVVLLVLACVVIAGCSDGDADINLGVNGNGGGNGGGGPNADDLTSLVIQQCGQTPEDQDPVQINGLAFDAGANDPNNQTFTNNCL